MSRSTSALPFAALFWAALLAGAAPAVLATSASAQAEAPVTRADVARRDKQVDERLDRFEKALRSFRTILLQSKDTGQPVEVRLAADPDPEVVALRQRLDDMEMSGRTQNGQIETLTHELDKARAELRALRAESKAEAERMAPVLARLQALEAAAQPVVEAAAAGGDPAYTPAAGPTPAPANDAAGAYARAKRILLAGDYPGAAVAFQDYVERYPDAPETAEARYWLGESLFVQDLHGDAATAYIGAIRGWPQTSWAPNAVVRLARALIELEKPADACRTLGELAKRYPNAPALVTGRAKQARADAKCG